MSCVAAGDTRVFAPLRTLDGFGVLGAPAPNAQAVPAHFEGRASAEHPPGLYGAGDAFMAVQTLQPGDTLTRFDFKAAGLAATELTSGAPVDYRGPLLAAAIVAFIADMLIVMVLSGKLRLRPIMATAGALLVFSAAFHAPDARAEPSQRDREAALNARLAYVVSGDPKIDDVSRMGLDGLSRALSMRTSFAPAEPAGVDPARDELAFYPMLYWPVVASAPQPSARTAARVAAYMKQGGTVVFDTRDALNQRPGDAPTPEMQWLRAFSKNLDIPELEVVPRDHVITKTFYLLDGFVGRYASGDTWVEALPPEPKDQAARPVRATDSVSAIVITSNDLAAAWAVDKRGQPALSAHARRGEAAGAGASRRRQSRDVYADRQLQIRSGACAGSAREVGAVRGGVRRRVAPPLVLRDGPLGLLSMRSFCSFEETPRPHPEEPAQPASRRTRPPSGIGANR